MSKTLSILIAILLATLASAAGARAASPYPHSPIPILKQPAEAGCMPCSRKCRLCWKLGKSSYPSLDACLDSCQPPDMPVISTCGVRGKC